MVSRRKATLTLFHFLMYFTLKEVKQLLYVFTGGHGSIKGQNKKALHCPVLHIIAVVYRLSFFIQQVAGTLDL